jgi:hypothetical protein
LRALRDADLVALQGRQIVVISPDGLKKLIDNPR